MTVKDNKTNTKRLGKGKRAYVRKMKQEASKAGVAYVPVVQQ